MLSLLLSPFCLVYCLFFRPKLLALAFVFLMGVVWVFWHWIIINEQALKIEQGRQHWQLLGEVGRVSQQIGRLEFDFYPQGPFKKLAVSCYQCPWSIERGDTWALALKLKPFISFHNPMGFDYRKWMLVKGYVAYGSVDLKQAFNRKVFNDSHTLAKQVSNTLSASDVPILRALLLGDKKALSARSKRLINGSGLGHLFVVSGMHVGMVAFIVTLLLVWLQKAFLVVHWRLGPVVGVVSGFGVAVFYAYLSGFNVPVVRACVMLFFVLILLLRKRNISVIDYLQLAILFVVLINPLAFMGVGSWLSFGIVGVLVLGMGLKRTWWKQPIFLMHRETP